MTGELPPVASIAASVKKILLTLAAAVAWFMPSHFIIMALLVFFWATAMASTTNTAKTRGLEGRVNGVVSQLGTTNANVTAAQNTANNALPKSGGTISGDVTITGNLTVNNTCTVFGSAGVHGDCNIIGRIGSSYSMPQGEPATQANPPNGTGGPSQYAGNFYTGSGAANWAQNITDKVNQIIGSLHNAGVYT